MKPRLSLKLMLSGTLACILLTLIWFFFTKTQPVRADYLKEFELIGAWIIVLIGWAVYFLDRFKRR